MQGKTQNWKGTDKCLSILRLALSIGETNSAYMQFSLPVLDKHDITICTYFGSKVSPPKNITVFEADGSMTGFVSALRNALTRKSYDIIHVHTPHVGFLYLVATLLRSRKSLPPAVVTVHSSFPNYKLRNRLLFLPVFALFKRVVCCSQASFDSVPKLHRWLGGNRLCAIKNGVDIDRVDRIVEGERHYLCNGHFTVATVGRLIESKNPFTVLSAFQQSADVSSRLVFVGEGALRDPLVTQSKTSGVQDQVELTGLIAREQVYRHLARADLLVSASHVEGMPIAVLEAMACRCPVVLSDIRPHREIANGVDFIPLVPPNDTAKIAREIRRFKAMSAKEIAAIGEKCRRLVEERFSLTLMHRTYETLYAQVLDEQQV